MFFAVAKHGLDRFPASLPEASGLVKLTKHGPISPHHGRSHQLQQGDSEWRQYGPEWLNNVQMIKIGETALPSLHADVLHVHTAH